MHMTEEAHIEVVMSRYTSMTPKPANLAQGVAHWDPPDVALSQARETLHSSENHKYGPALGLPALRGALYKKLERENGLDMTGQEVRMACEWRSRFRAYGFDAILPSRAVTRALGSRRHLSSGVRSKPRPFPGAGLGVTHVPRLTDRCCCCFLARKKYNVL